MRSLISHGISVAADKCSIHISSFTSTDVRMHLSRTLLRYGIVGLVSNGIGYLLYLLLTWLGMEYRVAVTLLFAVGVVQTFFFNKSWSFGHIGSTQPVLLRYWAVYVAAFFLNIAALTVLVEYVDVPHQIAQAILVFVIAGLIFIALRCWVFPGNTLGPRDDASSGKHDR